MGGCAVVSDMAQVALSWAHYRQRDSEEKVTENILEKVIVS